VAALVDIAVERDMLRSTTFSRKRLR